jgi:hypothetical protein
MSVLDVGRLLLLLQVAEQLLFLQGQQGEEGWVAEAQEMLREAFVSCVLLLGGSPDPLILIFVLLGLKVREFPGQELIFLYEFLGSP